MNNMIKRVIITLFCYFISFGCCNAYAQAIDSSFYNWTVYETKSDEYGNKKCYMVNRPVESDTNHNSRNAPYIIITRYQNERNEEVGIYSGFEYRLGSNIFIAIDDLKFTFLTNKDMAWTKTRDQDSFIIQEMLIKKNIFVRSDSSIGTFAVDKYSLKGVAKAYNRIKTICDS